MIDNKAAPWPKGRAIETELMASDQPPPEWETTKEDLLPYLRRLIVTVIVIGFALLLWQLREVLLLAFAAILVAVALLALTGLVRRLTGLGHRAALTVGGLLALAVISVLIWTSWPAFEEQLANLVTRLSESLDQMENIFGITLPANAQEIAQAISGVVDRIWSSLVTVAGALVTVITTLILVIFAGVFLAIDPSLYRKGLVLLFPRSWHQRVTHALNETGRGLRLWLQAQLLTMIVVGLMVGLGTWAIGLPSPLALGLIAGITEFVPIIGPFVGAIPAVLVAFGLDVPILIWTVILYVGVQQVEANLITPVLQRRIVSIPPVLLLFSFVALGVLFGALGIVVAAPLTIALYILVGEFYIGDVLSDRSAPAIGGRPPPKPAARQTEREQHATGELRASRQGVLRHRRGGRPCRPAAAPWRPRRSACRFGSPRRPRPRQPLRRRSP
jgi:predicted PurR-regulated permease PerM